VAATGEILRAAVALLIGFLLGSVIPADLLARRSGIDIRRVGDGNPGTVNAVKALGWPRGLITAVYDVFVGVVAIQIARLLGLADGPAYLAGVAALVGRRFPVFLGFRGGGQGMAASAGLLLYGIAVALSRGWLSTAQIAVLVAIIAITWIATRWASTSPLVMLPVLLVMLTIAHADWQLLVFMTAVAANMWIVQARVSARRFSSRGVSPMCDEPRG